MINTEFSSTKNLSQIVIGFVYARIILDFLSIFLYIAQIWDFQFPVIENFEDLKSLIGYEIIDISVLIIFLIFQIVITLGLIIFFLKWMYRSYKNLQAFNRKNLRSSPAGAVFWWFIPFANLIIPLRIINEIWHKSDYNYADSDEFSANPSSPVLHNIWWTFWVISIVLALVDIVWAFTPDSFGPAEIIFAIVIIISMLILGFTFIRVIKNITRRQLENSEKNKNLKPPMPPVFNREI